LGTDLFTLPQAARQLGKGVRTVQRWLQQGIIVGTRVGTRTYLTQSDLDILGSLAGPETLDVPSMAIRCHQAMAAAKSAQARVDALYDLLGLNSPDVPTDRVALVALHEKALAASESLVLLDISEVKYWAGVFFGLNEAHFDLLRRYCRDAEPWRRYIELGRILTNKRPEDPDYHRATYAYLESAKNRLRHMSYFYCRTIYNSKMADSVFGEVGSFGEHLASMMFNVASS
jgi:excisionase family DNA binding protein